MKRLVRTFAPVLGALVLLGLPLLSHAERGRRVPRRPPSAEAGRQVAPPEAARPKADLAPAEPAAAPAATDAARGPDAGEAAAPEENSGPEIRTVGEEGMRAHFVDHSGPWSVHAENLPTAYLFRLWREVGGPEVVSRLPLDRAYTISVHREPAERILARLLDGYGYTLHYDTEGRLDLVRVYSPDPSAGEFKTPRLVESLSSWRDAELAVAQPSAATTQSN